VLPRSRESIAAAVAPPAPRTTPRHGLVVGKFYPPHAGHHLLVRTAAACCERVTVVITAASAQSIPLALRVAWMREEHARRPNVTVVGTIDDNPYDYASDAVWRAHLELILRAARGVTTVPVDAVFTSEAYGDELGRRLKARHVCVDPARGLASISGTRVRADPVSTWEHLSPGARAWFARRVVVVGAESSGKTTLASDLTAALRARGGAFGLTRSVPEYARQYLSDRLASDHARAQLDATPRRLGWGTEEYCAIAEEQNRLEDEAARCGGPVLVCDTDAFAASVAHARDLGSYSADVESHVRAHPLYLLADPDGVPLRLEVRHGGRPRSWTTRIFADRLGASGRRWSLVRGGREERVRAALAAVDALLAEGWGLAPPLG
jgi:NadR type nicotinamide-nucleotide adenylyltransferase